MRREIDTYTTRTLIAVLSSNKGYYLEGTILIYLDQGTQRHHITDDTEANLLDLLSQQRSRYLIDE